MMTHLELLFFCLAGLHDPRGEGRWFDDARRVAVGGVGWWQARVDDLGGWVVRDLKVFRFFLIF